MSEQLVFDLPHRPALEADDFLVSDCNAAAVRLIDDWPRWPAPIHALVGPEGSGKTHLANVWRLKTGARPLGEDDLARPGVLDLSGLRAVLLEDLDQIRWDEKTLFHLINLCAEAGVSALMTARTPPAHWSAALPDLASRLRSLPVVSIGAPDDALLKAVLLKQFVDRQLDVTPPVIAFLAARMERSMQGARRLVVALDRAALARGGRITRPLAAQVLEETTLPPEGDQS